MVVLPAPLGPSTTLSSPFSISKQTLLAASTVSPPVWYSLVTFSKVI